MQTLPQTRDLVLIGGGHAHALVLLRWAMNPLAGARLTVIDPHPTAPYTGMLPGLIAGHYARADLEMNLVALARHAGARLILGRANGLDPVAKSVSVPGRPPVAYDVVSVDVGITSDLPQLPGFAEHAVAAKPLGGYAERWAQFLASGRAAPQIVVLGAGVAGVELALAMEHRLRAVPGRTITVIEKDSALPHLGAWARARLLALLAERGITLLSGTQAAAIEADGVVLADGRKIPSDFTLGAAGSRPQGWLADTGLPLTDGFITIDPELRSTAHPDVFAVGDCAHMAVSPRPKAGVFAVRQAPVLHHNLRAALTGGPMRAYRPQRDYLKLISLGERKALADKWGLPLAGRGLWWLKDRIDAKFMRMFHTLPAMPAAPLPREHTLGLVEALGDKPMCGGCGAKVGPDALRRALSGLAASGAVELGAGDDAAVLAMGETRQVIATDHLRAVTEDPYLMAKIATVHALGDVWAMGAKPQAALVSLILPRLSEDLQSRTLAEIMAGVSEVLSAAGASIAGGHTTQGAELTIGLTVTGVAGDRILTKGGARPGDALILTKPIGSGTLLAAEMQKRAPGRAMAALWPYLTQPQGAAAAILSPVAHAMTDVTGFGLAGHLDEMLQAGGVAADLAMAAIPLFDGAEAMAAAGVASTIAPANRAALLGRIAAPQTAAAALLFDPQSAGGLLAAVAEADAVPVLRQLEQAGFTAACIGTIRALDDQPALRVI
ncbi:selenide, water dikinase SelD [Pararhodobacter zhoushanensis]|uniref:Selenide, water dikinase SelD n=1 Tax=Pararhodobacter zhoushanensis TaxID=2479545 RepID=A0ABT3H434_9RHOB|nr:selenide, water dikinase SelD [Pararhodobacter zhoushanensis]MCW1934566.1 selenide, water dikinase SelD [Pararhodobacter zhoushanensis]